MTSWLSRIVVLSIFASTILLSAQTNNFPTSNHTTLLVQNKNQILLPFRQKQFPNEVYKSKESTADTNRSSGKTLSSTKKQHLNKSSSDPTRDIVGNVKLEWVQRYSSGGLPSDDYANAVITDNQQNVFVTGVSYTSFSGADYFTVKYNKLSDSLWTRRYNGRSNGFDEATAIGVDNDGNVFVTGYSFNVQTGYDFVTIKYTNNGDIDWVSEYNGVDDTMDIPVGIGIDKLGNVYIAGYEYARDGKTKIVTIKYTNSGAEQWVKKYNSGINSDDRPTAMVVDGSGACYITGYTNTSTSGSDYLVLKYDVNGNLLWSDQYSSQGINTDVATSIAIDSIGNSYVTGYTYQQSTKYDYTTIKYNQTGVRRWIAVYNDSLSGNDVATGIACSSGGNVFVTGSAWGGATSDDYLTIAYDSSGSVRWKNRYNGTGNFSDIPSGIVLDNRSNKLCITGYINGRQNGTRDIATIQYNTDGTKIWIDRYEGTPAGDDYASGITIDPKGNVFVLGTSMGETTGYDFVTLKYIGQELDQWPARFNNGVGNNWSNGLVADKNGNVFVIGTDSIHMITVKYDSSGIILWTAQFGNERSNATAITIDDAGNIYVAGYSRGSHANLDYVTIKYNSSGTQEWVSWYNGTSDGDDEPMGIAIDKQNNVYVTGTSVGTNSRKDYLTLKYDPKGNQIWSSRFNGNANLDDIPSGIVVDSVGNVYVTGTSIRYGSSNDFLTIKYDPNGSILWYMYYDGTGNGTDVAKAVAIDVNGNVYITGRSLGWRTSSDFVIIKYDSNGNQKWIVRYDGGIGSGDDPVALVLDQNKNIIVTGSTYSSSSSLNILTIKYNNDGIFQWGTVYNGTANGSDLSVNLRVDYNDNVYVTGTSSGYYSLNDYVLIKYDQFGVQKWVTYYNDILNSNDEARAMVMDNFGNIYVTGNSVGMSFRKDFLIMKHRLEASADQRWPVRAGGPGMSVDEAKALIVDSLGNTFIAGGRTDRLSLEDFLVLKYDKSGVLQWQSSYNGPMNNDDVLLSIAMDKAGNSYITGTLYSQFFGCDYGIVKFDKNGYRVWDAIYNGPKDGFDFATDIVVDDSSNVYVTGKSEGAFAYDYGTVKYNSAGTQQWVARYNGPSNGSDLAYVMTNDQIGNVYVGGSSFGYGARSDFAIVKYDRNGNEQWSARYNGTYSGDDAVVAMVADSNQNLYVTGWSAGSDTTYDIVTVKYDSSGQQSWVNRYSAGIKTYELPKAIAMDGEGSIYVTGYTFTSDLSTSNFVTIKYNNNGNQLWVRYYDGIGEDDDEATAIAVDSESNVYVTGKSNGTDFNYHYATIKYDKNGSVVWTARYTSFDNCQDSPVSIGLDKQKNVYITGTTSGADWSVISTVKYSQIETAVDNNISLRPEKFQLSQNYPNPFNPITKIQYHLPVSCWVTLKVYNLLGQEIIKLVDENQQAGVKEMKLNASSLPSGMYFYQLKTSSGYSETRKMMLLK